MTYTVGTLFSGIGVPDLAAKLLGMATVWQVEKEPYCQQVLRARFPEATLYGDIFDCHDLPYVDVIVAGFPCQPFSLAGRRLGENDERYLVPEMFRVIQEVKPRVVLFENVPGFASIADGDTFKQFLRALAEMGFDAEWGHLAASDFGAVHRRERWWCVAYADQSERPTRRGDRLGTREQASTCKCTGLMGNTHRAGRREQRRAVTVRAQQPAAERAGMGHAERGRRTGDARRRSGAVTPNRHARERRVSQPGVCRKSYGTTGGLDFVRPVARPGEPQYAHEPPRVVAGGTPNRAARLKALGNSMYFPAVYAIMANIRAWLEAQDAQTVEAAS